MANYELHDAVLWIDGKPTSSRGMFTLAELKTVNVLNAAKNVNRVWKLYSVTNPVTGQ